MLFDLPPAEIVVVAQDERLIQGNTVGDLLEGTQCGFGRWVGVAQQPNMRGVDPTIVGRSTLHVE